MINIIQITLLSSDNVGTDTPPQTPPNAKSGTSGSGAQGNLMGNASFMAGGSSYGNLGGGGSLSSCSRGGAGPGGLPMPGTGGQGNGPDMHSRYQGQAPANTHTKRCRYFVDNFGSKMREAVY